MGILDDISSGIKSDISWKARQGVSDVLEKGVSKLFNKKKADKCPNCKAPISETDKVCGQCGVKLSLICKEGHSNPYGTKFCKECGEKLK